MPYPARPVEERVAEKIVRAGPDDCWGWIGCKTGFGYGRLRIGEHHVAAHRVVYMILVSPVPAGMCVCHRCDNPGCVNPKHLFLGTVGDNNRDRTAKGRSASGDRNASRLYPEKRIRGDKHWTRQNPTLVLRGSKHGRARVNETDVRTIRKAHAWGARFSDLGRRYGVTPQAIYRIVKRLSWREVP